MLELAFTGASGFIGSAMPRDMPICRPKLPPLYFFHENAAFIYMKAFLDALRCRGDG